MVKEPKIKCIFWKEGKCNSDYNKGYKCNGINPPCDCPYSHDKDLRKLKTKE